MFNGYRLPFIVYWLMVNGTAKLLNFCPDSKVFSHGVVLNNVKLVKLLFRCSKVAV